LEPLILCITHGHAPAIAIAAAALAFAIFALTLLSAFAFALAFALLSLPLPTSTADTGVDLNRRMPVGVQRDEQGVAPCPGVVIAAQPQELQRFRVAGVEVVGRRQRKVGDAGLA